MKPDKFTTAYLHAALAIGTTDGGQPLADFFHPEDFTESDREIARRVVLQFTAGNPVHAASYSATVQGAQDTTRGEMFVAHLYRSRLGRPDGFLSAPGVPQDTREALHAAALALGAPSTYQNPAGNKVFIGLAG